MHPEGDSVTDFLDENRIKKKVAEISASRTTLSHYDNKTLKSIIPQVIGTLLVASNNIVVGIALAYSGILIPALESPDSDIKVSLVESSWIASTPSLCLAIGGLFLGILVDKIGRLRTIMLAVIPNSIGWALIATSSNTTTLLIGRILTGLAGAIGANPGGVYIAEVTRPDLRGAMLSVMSLASSIGMEIVYLQGALMHWRTLAWTCILYTIVPCLLLLTIHESPSWLISKGKTKQAKKSLEWLHKYQKSEEGQSVAQVHFSLLQKEFELKLEKESREKKKKSNFLQEFMNPTVYKPTLIIIGLFLIQQFCGVYIILFYAVTFFQGVGTNIDPSLASVLIAGITVVMSVIDIFTLKIFKKNTLMLTSCVGMAISLTVSGLFTKWIQDGSTDKTWVPVVFLFIYMISSMIGILPVPWTLTAELFPLEIRGAMTSISVTIGAGTMFAAVQSYRTLDMLLGGSHGVQFFFATVSVLGVGFVYFFVPETYGKKLSEIEDYFKK